MREIKFRAWHLIEARWAMESEIENIILVNTFYHGGRFQLDERAKHGLANDLGTILELMQYTGLKDKNGKEICEGDNVKFTFDDEDSCSGATYDEIYLVEWNNRNLQFEFSDNKYHPMGTHQGKHTIWSMSHMSYETEVIGNMYEHPHLLKEAESNVHQA